MARFGKFKISRAKQKPLPFGVYAGTFIALVVTGLAVSAYLSVSHYRLYTDIFYSSFCAISQSLNCDTVSESRYSLLFGFPVPLWGLGGYLLLGLLTPLALRKDARCRRMWALLLLISGIFCLISIWFAYLSSFRVRSYCLMCIVSYAVNFFLLLACVVVRDRYGDKGFFRNLKADIRFLRHCRRAVLSLMLPFLVGWGLLFAMLPEYWIPQSLTVPDHVDQGVTEEGHPWIGAAEPVLEIVEFADYQCFQCWKMHQYLRHNVTAHPDKIRLVHVHYPMDHEVNPIVEEPFHIGAGFFAAMAIYAQANDRFWEMNDHLYFHWRRDRRINSKSVADAFGFNPDELAAVQLNPYIMTRLLKLNIRYGMKLRVMGTPSFLINGRLYQGTFPFELIDNLTRQ